MKIRVGFGYDVHALVPDRELWLGGIKSIRWAYWDIAMRTC